MNSSNWLFRPWRQWLKFDGRATRREYWLFLAQLLILFFIIIFSIGVFGSEEPDMGTAEAFLISGVTIAYFFFATVSILSASVRRLHDHDKSGWLYLLSIIPFVGWIFYLIMMLTPGTRGENSYGFDPREGDQASTDELGAVFS